MTTPPGWVIGNLARRLGNRRGAQHIGLRPVLPLGQNGAAVNLTTKYTNNIYTHLTTQEYSIPVTVLASPSVRGRTEANWDEAFRFQPTVDGTVVASARTQRVPRQISTVNTNCRSWEGIIDGSSVPNGCGPSNTKFELAPTTSPTSRSILKARFSFFSDTYIEGDGWYIDDAGIEIDVFEPSGHWVSSSILLTPVWLWLVDGWYERPNGTSLLFDSSTGTATIPAYRISRCQRMLPLTNEHPAVHVRVWPQRHLRNAGSQFEPWTNHLHWPTTHRGRQVASSSVLVDSNGTLQVIAPSIDLPASVAYAHDGYRLTTVGDNLTWATSTVKWSALPMFLPLQTTYLNHSLGDIGLIPSFTLVASGGESSSAAVGLRCPHAVSAWRWDGTTSPDDVAAKRHGRPLRHEYAMERCRPQRKRCSLGPMNQPTSTLRARVWTCRS